jgi:hypothetical protein
LKLSPTPIAKTPNSIDLLFLPTKALDLWRIEEEGTDLYLHQRNFISPSICLEDLCLGVLETLGIVIG